MAALASSPLADAGGPTANFWRRWRDRGQLVPVRGCVTRCKWVGGPILGGGVRGRGNSPNRYNGKGRSVAADTDLVVLATEVDRGTPLGEGYRLYQPPMLPGGDFGGRPESPRRQALAPATSFHT